jgi:hypothetical protein
MTLSSTKQENIIGWFLIGFLFAVAGICQLVVWHCKQANLEIDKGSFDAFRACTHEICSRLSLNPRSVKFPNKFGVDRNFVSGLREHSSRDHLHFKSWVEFVDKEGRAQRRVWTADALSDYRQNGSPFFPLWIIVNLDVELENGPH